ncbi:MAG: helix-turn-helix domain-containing protein [Acidobacteriaceae bacterium]
MAGSVRRKITPSGSSTVAANATRANQRRAALTFPTPKPVASENRGAWEAREVMDIRQAAAYLGISSDSLYKYAAESVIPAFKLGNRWRFKRSLLDSWMELQSSPPGLELATEKSVKSRQKKPVGRAH